MVPDHVLILPVGHHQSLSILPDAVEEEIEKYPSQAMCYAFVLENVFISTDVLLSTFVQSTVVLTRNTGGNTVVGIMHDIPLSGISTVLVQRLFLHFIFCNLTLSRFAAFTDAMNVLPLTTHMFKSALKKYFKKLRRVPVFFERNYKTSHLQIQTVPIPCSMANRLKRVFQVSQYMLTDQDQVTWYTSS
jgi:hypothetical protein